MAVKNPHKPSRARSLLRLVTAARKSHPAPYVLVDIGDDANGRGDIAGRIGVGKALARLSHARYVYTDSPTLQKTYGADKSEGQQRADFLRDHGLPHTILSEHSYPCDDHPNAQTVTSITHYNEGIAAAYLDTRIGLVSHHLFPEVLAEAGAEFDKNYPHLRQPLIAVLIASPYTRDGDLSVFTKKLASVAASYPEATIFLCGSGRTPRTLLTEATQELKDNLARDEDDEQVDVQTYQFKDNDPANPYKGLIARADHFIVWGESQSLNSEPLAGGKTVHFFRASNHQDIIKSGYGVDFRECPNGQPLKTKKIEPVNVAFDIARAILKKKKEKLAERLSKIDMLSSRFTARERALLAKIGTDDTAITRLPSALHNNHAFIKAALTLNGLAIQHLSITARRDPALAAAAIKHNPRALSFIAPSLFDNKAFVIKILPFLSSDKISDLYKQISPRLQRDTDTCRHMAGKLPRIEKLIPEEIRKQLNDDEDYAFRKVAKYRDEYRNISPRLQNSLRFAKKIFAKDEKCYLYMKLEFQVRPDFAKRFFASYPHYFDSMPPAAQDNEFIARLAVEQNEGNIRYLSPRLRNDASFLLSLRNVDRLNMGYVGEIARDNDDFVYHCIENDSDSFEYASSRLKESPDCVLWALENARKQGLPAGNIIRHVKQHVLNDVDFIIQAQRKHHGTLNCLNYASEEYFLTINRAAGLDLARGLARATDIPSNKLQYWMQEDLEFLEEYYKHRPDADSDERLRHILHRTREDAAKKNAPATAVDDTRDPYTQKSFGTQPPESHYYSPYKDPYEHAPMKKSSLSEIFLNISHIPSPSSSTMGKLVAIGFKKLKTHDPS